jgi:hypothetical protein
MSLLSEHPTFKLDTVQQAIQLIDSLSVVMMNCLTTIITH